VSGWPEASLFALLVVVDFLILLATSSLRDFSRSRLDEICLAKDRRDRFGDVLRWDEEVLLVCELLAVLLTAVLVGVLVHWGEFFTLPKPDWQEWLLYIARVAGTAIALLVFAVVLPWTIARAGGERFLFHAWPLLRTLQRLLRPATVALQRLDELMHRLSGRERLENGELSSITEEIRTVVDEGQREGLLEHEARRMIHRVMELQDVDAGAIMTPRTEMFCIRADATLEEARELLLQAGHSRVPVIGETTDDIKGILYAKDLLQFVNMDHGTETPLVDIVREPFYVPETTPIDKLLETMKRERVHLAIVVDEYGGVAGLVSMEDILEEIVGDIVDEYDAAEETGIARISDDVIDVHARVHIDDLNEQFGFDLPEDADYDTISGFVFHQLGRIPAVGETFTWGQLRVTVQDADRRRIKRIRVERDRSLAAAASEES